MLPLVPFLCMAGAALVCAAWESATTLTYRRAARCGVGVILVLVLMFTVGYALAFVRIYAQQHAWLQASAWICEHVPQGATLMVETWDDPLPVSAPGRDVGCPVAYSSIAVDMHAAETDAKREQLLDALQSCDYVVLSSDRLYASLTRLPQRFPLAIRYYQQLFRERLGFQLVAAPAVYPNLGGVILCDNPRTGTDLATPALLAQRKLSGWVIDLGRADESFTVYDHPQPLIFAKTEHLARTELEKRLTAPSTMER